MNCITFFNELVTLVEQTEADVLLYNVDRFEQEVKDSLPKIETAFRSQELMERFDEYTDHAMKLSTRNIRGALCAMAERAAVPALLSSDPLRDGTLANSQRMGFVAHKVLDVPKKHTAEQVTALAERYMQNVKLKRDRCRGKRARRPKRSTELAKAQLRMVLPVISKCKAFLE